jgi:hypothetical protein
MAESIRKCGYVTSNEQQIEGLKAIIRGRAAHAVRQAADFLVTQLNAVHSGVLAARVEMVPQSVGIAAQVIIDSPIAVYVEHGTGIYGDPETGPHRITPWVYCTPEGTFRTTWGMHPQPWFTKTFEDNKGTMEILIAEGMNEVAGGLSDEIPEEMSISLED